MNDEFNAQDVAVKTMNQVIIRGKELKLPEERREILEDSISRIQSDDLLTIIYTSGTTGQPKGVMLSHHNVLTNMIASIVAVSFDEQETFLSYLPWCHSFERTTIAAAFLAGSTVAIPEGIDSIVLNLKEIKPTIMTTVPKMLESFQKKLLLEWKRKAIQKREYLIGLLKLDGNMQSQSQRKKIKYL